MIRMPIQIAVSTTGDGPDDLFALCNDGTIFVIGKSGHWTEMPPIPQDESKDPLHKLYRENVDQTERLAVQLHVIEDVRKLAERMSKSMSHQQQRMASQLFDALGAFSEPSDVTAANT